MVNHHLASDLAPSGAFASASVVSCLLVGGQVSCFCIIHRHSSVDSYCILHPPRSGDRVCVSPPPPPLISPSVPSFPSLSPSSLPLASAAYCRSGGDHDHEIMTLLLPFMRPHLFRHDTEPVLEGRREGGNQVPGDHEGGQVTEVDKDLVSVGQGRPQVLIAGRSSRPMVWDPSMRSTSCT